MLDIIHSRYWFIHQTGNSNFSALLLIQSTLADAIRDDPGSRKVRPRPQEVLVAAVRTKTVVPVQNERYEMRAQRHADIILSDIRPFRINSP